MSTPNTPNTPPPCPPCPPSTPTTPSPILRHPETGCTATLSASLVPAQMTHSPPTKCKCVAARSSEEIARLAATAGKALAEGILESEKPALDFAKLLLGGQVVYDQQ